MFNTKKIIIIVIVVVLAGVLYGIFVSNKAPQSASGVVRQTVGNSASGQSGIPGLDGPGKEFVTQLLAIQNIRFNLQLFADPVFQGLQDRSRPILPQETGRPNPFAPLEIFGISGEPVSTDIFNLNANLAGTSTRSTTTTRPANTTTNAR